MVDKKNKGTVLVTGGSGFMGSYTAQALTDAGYKVRIFDRAPSPHLVPGQEMITGDIMDAAALTKAAQACDYFYHFAGIADIEEADKNPAETARINIQGTINALEAARAAGVRRFVFASTIYVYSTMGGFYRVSKQACENFIENFQEKYGLPFTILRYGSLYGRRAGPKNGIYRLVRAALERGEVLYNGHPEAMREYIHVTDAAKLSVDILGDDYANRHLILTGQERMRVADVMKMISEMTPGRPPVKFGEQTLTAHYVMTPYSYNPKMGHKVTRTDHVDMGQGILDCIAEIHEEINQDAQKIAS